MAIFLIRDSLIVRSRPHFVSVDARIVIDYIPFTHISTCIALKYEINRYELKYIGKNLRNRITITSQFLPLSTNPSSGNFNHTISKHFLLHNIFLEAELFFKPLCPSVGLLVGRSVGRSATSFIEVLCSL